MQPATAGVRPRPRIETLADLIFGLSLSIGSIALIANPPNSTGEITTHILAFAYTFFVLITAWLIYTTYMSVLPTETRTVTFLNVGLLLLVAIVPYLLNGVEVVNSNLTPNAVSSIQNYSSTLFALDLGGILLILATFAHVISLEEKRLVAPELVTLFRNGRNRMVILAFLTLVSVAPQFWEWTLFGVPIRLYLWYPPLVSYWVGRAVRPDSRTYKLA
jgi:Endosomal/lysosomal potassium channel TMEM175